VGVIIVMIYKTYNDEIWTIDKGDWISTKYYDKAELMKLNRKRNMLFVAALMMYIVVCAVVLFL